MKEEIRIIAEQRGGIFAVHVLHGDVLVANYTASGPREVRIAALAPIAGLLHTMLVTAATKGNGGT